jgi:hypothetical protein
LTFARFVVIKLFVPQASPANGFDGLSLAAFTLSFPTLGINTDTIGASRSLFFVWHKSFLNQKMFLDTPLSKVEGLSALFTPSGGARNLS